MHVLLILMVLLCSRAYADVPHDAVSNVEPGGRSEPTEEGGNLIDSEPEDTFLEDAERDLEETDNEELDDNNNRYNEKFAVSARERQDPWGRRSGSWRSSAGRRSSWSRGSSRRRFMRRSWSRRRSIRRRSWSRRRSIRRRSWSRRRSIRRRSWSRRRSIRRRSWSRRRSIRRRRSWARRRSIRRRSWARRRSIRRRRSWARRRSIRRRRSVRRRSWRRRSVTRRRSVWRRRTVRRRSIRRRRFVRRRRMVRRRSVRRRSVRRRSFRRRTARRRTVRRRRRIWTRRRSTRVNSNSKTHLKVSKGQLTFNSEGNDKKGSKYFSRKPHVPGRWSGVTLGRGYDIGQKLQKQVVKDLVKAGISKTQAEKIAKGAGLKGQKAKNFVKNNLNNYVLNRQQQKKLFQISYSRQESEAKRLTNKYYKTNWSNLNSKIKQVLTDMKFRGDLRPTSSKAGQVALKKAVKANNVEQVKKVLSNKNYWKNVPKDRFERRVKFLNQNSG